MTGSAPATGRQTLFIINEGQAHYTLFDLYELRNSAVMQNELKKILAGILDTKLEVVYGNGVLELLKQFLQWNPDKGYRICSRCGNVYFEAPALSRKDNKTEICSQCGMQEALDIFNISIS
jgi:hypothetical protein